MKIVYAFIANFPPFKNAEMNFVSDYNCKLDGETLRIHHSKVLPDGFFSPDENLHVSAIVGPNGSGKTSIVRFLGAIMHPTEKQDFVLVVEAKGDILVYYNLKGRKIKVECEGCSVKLVKKRYERNSDFKYDDIENCFNVVYYSPHYSLSTPFRFSNDDFANLSTTYLLNSVVDGSYGHTRREGSSVFFADEFYRLVRFYESCKDSVSDVIGHKLDGVAFLPNPQMLSPLYYHYAEMLNREQIRITETRKGVAVWERTLSDDELRRIKAMVSCLGFEFKDAFMSIFQCFVSVFWQKKIYKDCLFKDEEYGYKLYVFCISLIKSMDSSLWRRKVLTFLKMNKPNEVGPLK